ncbi:Uncharacterized protein OS=Planctomyces maris DSM 8797 GN=PM8797T_10509 PE=4 SV=1 [Gemmataceae bacterium]|nr:Uncharacterized protein OS=Planctomyces maris DSM 8797 GN=PM8797T_10509 PE=4 SV=1 [Gemmataceae bacterium]VTT97226.1 Uncharacterized protein OS=Planctomyces maris DSM 8797 GN=PM8797T_10509 PE=4 SV=1 [Gemmataceae bacterium]
MFNGSGGQFPSGVFSTVEQAERWIATHRLSGMLTWYPLDVGVYEWTIEKKCFIPRKDYQKTPDFIQTFSSAHTGHYHYENGGPAGAGLADQQQAAD